MEFIRMKKIPAGHVEVHDISFTVPNELRFLEMN